MEENIRDEFDELTTDVIFALNRLLQNDEVGKRDKALVKISHFKQWFQKFTDEVDAERVNQLNK